MSDITQTSFQLEQAIMAAWGVTDDLELIAQKVENGNLVGNELVNLLLALKQLQQLRFEKAFDLFESVHRHLCVNKS